MCEISDNEYAIRWSLFSIINIFIFTLYPSIIMGVISISNLALAIYYLNKVYSSTKI